MKQNTTRRLTVTLALPALLLLSTLNSQLSAAPLGTAFTYQGRLTDGANPATGGYDLRFTVYDAATNGNLKAVVTNANVAVTNGLFTTPVDFGQAPDNFNAMWLEIGVRTNGSAGDFTAVSPRQALLPAPYAFYALNSSNAVTAENAVSLLGVLPGAQLAGNYSGVLNFDNTGNSFSGNGAGLTALNANNLASGTVDDARLSANVALLNADQTFYGNNVFNLPLGIGVTPAWPLDVQAVQAVGRFTSTYSYFGSVIELQNSTTDFYPYMLGAINFNDGYDNYPGQIAYLTGDAMNFRVGGEDSMMWLDLSGLYVNGALGIQGALSCNNLYLPATTGDSGVIFSGGNPFIHAYGNNNLFAGVGAGNLTMTGGENTGVGTFALSANTDGSYNTAIGQTALAGNQSGSGNTAVGSGALVNNTNGSYNIALGFNAGYNLTAGSSNIDIGNQGLSSDTNLIRIGDGQTQTFIAGIIKGNGGGLTNFNASQLTGTIPLAQLPGVVVTNNNATSVNLSGSFTGNGGALTNVNANNLSTGTVPLARLSGITSNQLDAATWQLATNLNGGNAALASNLVSGIAITNAFITNSVFAGNGANVTNVNANNLSTGTVPLARLSGITSNQLDAATWQLATNLNGGNAALASNLVSGIAITNAFITNSVFAGNGAGLTLNANNLYSGTVPDARLSTNVALLNANQTFGGNNVFNGLVGIGVTPGYPLDVLAGFAVGRFITTNNTSGSVIELRNTTSGASYLGAINFNNSGGTYPGQINYTGNNNLIFQVNSAERMRIASSGNVGIGNTSPGNLLVVGSSGSPAYCNGTTWVNGSDRNSKEAFAAINPRTVLEKVSALPITEWKYKVETDGTRHLGPVAQDFHAAFGLNGTDDKHIATVDEEGVALAAIQGLNQKLNEKDAEIQELKARLERLEQVLNAKNGGGQ